MLVNRKIIISFILLFGFVGTWLGLNMPELFSYLIIAAGLGLRHGLDADHIVVIDNITRKLVSDNKTSATTGLFFALGHSTIVFLMTIMVVLGLNSTHDYWQSIDKFGNNFGAIISMLFLSITLILNIIMLRDVKKRSYSEVNSNYPRSGNYLLRSIDNPHKMYLVGFLFGLGFDTATEVGLLALAATTLLHGVSVYWILLLPISFACGM